MKISKIIGLIVLSLSFSIFATTNDSERLSLDMNSKKEIINALEKYELLHGSFFNYDSKKVAAAAETLKQAMKSISHQEISNLLKFSTKKLEEIKTSSSRDENNQNYHLVSMALIHIVSKYDVGNDYNAYSCPMVKKKWLQNSKKQAKVHNPYAPSMPHCGGKDTEF